MPFCKRPVRTLIAAAIALAAVPALAAESPFSRTVFFGDSLTDSGYFRPLLPPSAQAVTGKFTTNPAWVWAEYVADYYGLNASPNGNGQVGDNYAAGGATVATDTVGALGPIPSLKTQATRYLAANGGKADANALYTVWGGPNDLLGITNPAQAPAVIGAAVTNQIGIVGTLQQAGARYVMVPNLPDIGLTPLARSPTTTRCTAVWRRTASPSSRWIPSASCRKSSPARVPTASSMSPRRRARWPPRSPVTRPAWLPRMPAPPTCSPTASIRPRPPTRCWASTPCRCWKARACSRC